MAKTVRKKAKSVRSTQPALVVGVGMSVNGLSTLKTFFSALDSTNNICFVVVPHIDSSGKRLTLEAIKKITDLPVTEISSDKKIKARSVFLAPPHRFVKMKDGVFSLSKTSGHEEDVTVIDHFFQSAAKDQKIKAVAVVLTGDGADGTLGTRAISDAGGVVLVQAPETAEQPSMPQAVISNGTADYVLKVQEMPVKLKSYEEFVHRLIDDKALHSLRDQIGHSLNLICEILHNVTRHDFKHYKTTTLIRRIQRRMQVLQIFAVDEYVERMRERPDEVEALFRELLINVTSFFRDPDAFEALREQVISRALAHRPTDQKFRVWVAGCSTGEEVYTLAILVREELDKLAKKPEVQIIATDIDEGALAQARKGIYSASIADHVSPERLNRFFVKKAGKYHISKEIRELCLFSSHNLINDPPFSQLDLISCRNVLIYLGLHLQKKLIPVFHYALRPGGYLFLGNSESLSSHKELFKTISARHRIAQRKATAIQTPANFGSLSTPNFQHQFSESNRTHETDLLLIGQRIVLDEFAPKYAIVNDECQIVSVSSGIATYMDPSEGNFQNNLIRLVKASLRLGLRSTFSEAKKHKRKIYYQDATLKSGDSFHRVGITVQPMPKLGDEDGLFMVVFHDLGKLEPKASAKQLSPNVDNTEIVEQLERELARLREDLDQSVQDLEASNEELKSSNEELLSMNEELQSANEELETSKEDVQNVNETLMRTNTDLENLLSSTEIATLFLDENLNIKSFTPQVSTIYNLKDSDIGRPISHFTHLAKKMPSFPSVSDVVKNDRLIEDPIDMTDGRSVLRRILPYRTSEGLYNGVVVTFVDVTHLRTMEGRYQESEKRFQIMADSAPVLVWMADTHKQRNWFNRGWLEWTGRTMEQELGRGWTEGIHPDDLDNYIKFGEKKFDERKELYAEYRLRHHTGEYRWISNRAVPRFSADGVFEGYIGGCMDIHAQKLAAHQLAENKTRLEMMIQTSPSFMCMLSGPDFVFEQANEKYLQLVGHRQVIGKTIREALPEVSDQGFIKLLEEVRSSGKPHIGREVPVFLQVTPNGPMQEHYLDFVYQPDDFVNGRAEKIFVHGTDVTAKVLARRVIENSKAEVENERKNFRSLFKQTPEMVCILKGPEHLFEFVNEAHIRVLGFDATGMTVREAQPESVEVHGILDDVYRTGKTAELVEIPVTVGARLRYFNLTYAARWGMDGKVDGVMILGIEITDQVLGQRSVSSQKEALEMTLAGASTDQVLKVLTKMLEEQLPGRAHAVALLANQETKRLHHAVSASMPKEYLDAIEDMEIGPTAGFCGATAYLGKPIVVADTETDPLWQTRRELARKFHLKSCWSAPILSSDGKVLGTFAIYYREQRSAQDSDFQLLDLVTRTAALVIERKESMEALRIAKEAAELANESKTRFLANMSHEIRTPLAAVIGFSDLMPTLVDASSEAAGFVERIQRNAKQLNHLIDELLDLSKIEANRLEIEKSKFDPRSLIDDTFASLSLRAQEKGLDLQAKWISKIPAFIQTDATRLRQILLNVIGNAVKFTEKGHVLVEFNAYEKDHKNRLQIRVSDTGIGLSHEQQQKIFEPFIQADSSVSRKYGGTGLGLAISRRLANLLGGSLNLEESALGKGTIFNIDIETENVHAGTDTTPSSADLDYEFITKEKALKDRRILVVDDVPDNVTIVRLLLAKTGAILETATSGPDAIEKVLANSYDLILLDIQMPGMDGHQVVKELRSRGKKIPIIALTAHAMKEEKIKSLQSGFDGYLSKPVKRAVLIKAVCDILLPGYSK